MNYRVHYDGEYSSITQTNQSVGKRDNGIDEVFATFTEAKRKLLGFLVNCAAMYQEQARYVRLLRKHEVER